MVLILFRARIKRRMRRGSALIFGAVSPCGLLRAAFLTQALEHELLERVVRHCRGPRLCFRHACFSKIFGTCPLRFSKPHMAMQTRARAHSDAGVAVLQRGGAVPDFSNVWFRRLGSRRVDCLPGAAAKGERGIVILHVAQDDVDHLVFFRELAEIPHNGTHLTFKH